jgi:hypothetical protein
MRIGESIFDKLKKHPVCSPMNDPEKDVEDPRNFDRVWINPNDQFSFNAAWCTEQDLRDWMEGKGIMVKGNTPEEKKKYWDYAVFEKEGGFGSSRWLIKYTWKWFDKFVTDFDPYSHIPGDNGHIRKPLKIKSIKIKDPVEKQKREEEAIISMYAPFINEIVKDMEYREWDAIRNECEKDFYGIKRTLYCFGIGYMGACNTPEEICNLSWVQDIVFGKAQYLYFKKIGMELPDFEWLINKTETNNKKYSL